VGRTVVHIERAKLEDGVDRLARFVRGR